MAPSRIRERPTANTFHHDFPLRCLCEAARRTLLRIAPTLSDPHVLRAVAPLGAADSGFIFTLSFDVSFMFHSSLSEEGHGGMTFSLLSPWFALACVFLLAYMRSTPHAGGNSPYPHINGSLLLLCIIIPTLLGYSPAPSSGIWTWTFYLSLWMIPTVLIIYCLLLSPLHVIWSPADLLIGRKELYSSNPPARILYDPETSRSGCTAHDVVAEYVRSLPKGTLLMQWQYHRRPRVGVKLRPRFYSPSYTEDVA